MGAAGGQGKKVSVEGGADAEGAPSVFYRKPGCEVSGGLLECSGVFALGEGCRARTRDVVIC